jgi:transposase
VGAYLRLVPGRDQSGDSDPQQRISKRGYGMLRRLLVGSAHYLLGPFGKDPDLRRHGEKLAARGGGKSAKKRAVVAVARKLSVLSCTAPLDDRRDIRSAAQLRAHARRAFPRGMRPQRKGGADQ